jgi:hypothetical protein
LPFPNYLEDVHDGWPQCRLELASSSGFRSRGWWRKALALLNGFEKAVYAAVL